MKEIHYMISDAAKKVDVESHVLRYWEEELALPIQRNEMGHRYYTEEDIHLFQNIKNLKDQGFQLKAIKLLLPELAKKDPESLSNLLLLKEELNSRAEEMETRNASVNVPADLSDLSDLSPAEQKLLQFQEIVGQAVRQIMEENNRQLVRQMSRQVSQDIAEDLDGLLSQREQRDEERFRKLDNAIREKQRGYREAAVTTMDNLRGKKTKRGFFKKH